MATTSSQAPRVNAVAAVPIEADNQAARFVLLSISAAMAASDLVRAWPAHLGPGDLRGDPLIFRHA
jgi:hypothetical protein